MKRLGLGLVVAVVAVSGGGCSFASDPATTTSLVEPTAPSTTAPQETTTTPPPVTTTSMATTTTTTTATTLALVPPALPIVAEPVDWTQLVEVEYSFDVRYDGTYLLMREPELGPIVVVQDGKTILSHVPTDDQEWIL